MSRESVLILLAVLVILSPFSGIPFLWLEIALPIIGVLVLIIGVSLRRSATAPHAPAEE